METKAKDIITEMQEEQLPQEEFAEVQAEGDSIYEQMARSIILSYEQAFNHHNTKDEIKFSCTITTHKVATKEGNKDIAYLRLDRSIRAKDVPKDTPNEWETKLLHQELYPFRNMQERLNPNKPWKEQLFVNLITRLVGAGLEYAELLQRLKRVEENKIEDKQASNLVVATELPRPLSPDEQQYADWVKKEKEKEGIK